MSEHSEKTISLSQQLDCAVRDNGLETAGWDPRPFRSLTSPGPRCHMATQRDTDIR